MTYVEAKFGLRVCDSKPSDTGARGHSDPMDVGAVNSLASVKGERSSSPGDGCLSAVEIFNETAMQAITPACNRLAKAIRPSHGPRVSPQSQAKVRVKRTRKNPKDSKVPQAQAKAKTSKTGISGLETVQSETSSGTQESVQMRQVCTTETS